MLPRPRSRTGISPISRRAVALGGKLVAGQAGHVGVDFHRVAGADPLLADQQPQLRPPAEEDVAELVQPAARRQHPVTQLGRRARAGSSPDSRGRLPLDRLRHVLGQLEPQRHVGQVADVPAHLVHRAQREVFRQPPLDADLPGTGREQNAQRRHQQQRRIVAQRPAPPPSRPERGPSSGTRQGQQISSFGVGSSMGRIVSLQAAAPRSAPRRAATHWSAVIPSISASGFSTMRWRRTGAARSRTSSGVT